MARPEAHGGGITTCARAEALIRITSSSGSSASRTILIRDLYGSRQQDTGFTQYGAHTKLAARLAGDQNLTLWYQRSDLDRVRGYKDMWGGLGRLRSDFEPQALQFFYARYEKSGLGFLDSLSGTFSINSQSDGSIRQGLSATNTITRDEIQVNSFGYALQATTHIANRNAVVFGGEIYNERIDAWRDDTDPRTNVAVEKRALYPNGSRYATYGLFAQDTIRPRARQASRDVRGPLHARGFQNLRRSQPRRRR